MEETKGKLILSKDEAVNFIKQLSEELAKVVIYKQKPEKIMFDRILEIKNHEITIK